MDEICKSFVQNQINPKAWPKIVKAQGHPVTNSDQGIITLAVPADLIWFSGHFPGQPVLPGVVQIHWAITFCKHIFGLGDSFHALENVKFLSVIEPACLLELHVQYQPNLNRAQFVYRNAKTVFSEGKIQLKK